MPTLRRAVSVADAGADANRRTEDQERAQFFHHLRHVRIFGVGIHRILIRPIVDDVERIGIVDLLVEIVVEAAFFEAAGSINCRTSCRTLSRLGVSQRSSQMMWRSSEFLLSMIRSFCCDRPRRKAVKQSWPHSAVQFLPS